MSAKFPSVEQCHFWPAAVMRNHARLEFDPFCLKTFPQTSQQFSMIFFSLELLDVEMSNHVRFDTAFL